jgi:hypothetical protein
LGLWRTLGSMVRWWIRKNYSSYFPKSKKPIPVTQLNPVMPLVSGKYPIAV